MSDRQWFCEECGGALPSGVRFCEQCGHPVSPDVLALMGVAAQQPAPTTVIPQANPTVRLAQPVQAARPIPAMPPAQSASAAPTAPAHGQPRRTGLIAGIVAGVVLLVVIVAYVVATLTYGGIYDNARSEAKTADHALESSLEAADKLLDRIDDSAVGANFGQASENLDAAYKQAQHAQGLPVAPNRALLWRVIAETKTLREDTAAANDAVRALDDAVDGAHQAWQDALDELKAEEEAKAKAEKDKADTQRQGGHYANTRYGYALDVPDDFAWQTEVGDGDGYIFANDSLDMTISVQGKENTASLTPQSALDQAAAGHSDAYTALLDNGMVVSYQEDGRIVYIKSIVTTDSIATLTFDYPASQSAQGDAIVEQVAPTFG